MGDDQWEDVEIAMNSAYEDNYASGDAYVEDLTAPRAHVDARVPDNGKYLACVGFDQRIILPVRAVSQMY